VIPLHHHPKIASNSWFSSYQPIFPLVSTAQVKRPNAQAPRTQYGYCWRDKISGRYPVIIRPDGGYPSSLPKGHTYSKTTYRVSYCVTKRSNTTGFGLYASLDVPKEALPQ